MIGPGLSTIHGNAVETFIRGPPNPLTTASRRGPVRSLRSMTLPIAAYVATRNRRNAPSLPFGWGAATVLLVGAVLLILGIVLILFGFMQFITGTVGNATSGDFSIGAFFSGFFGAMMLFVIGGVLAGVGGWMVRLWWLFLILGAVAGTGASADTVRGREAMRAGDVRVRCRSCGRLNPEEAQFCISCGKPV